MKTFSDMTVWLVCISLFKRFLLVECYMDVLSAGFLALPTLTFLFDNFPIFKIFFFLLPSAKQEQLLVLFIVSIIDSRTPKQHRKLVLA